MNSTNSFSILIVFVFAFAYEFQSASSAEKPEAARIREEDVSKYSDMLLGDQKTWPAIDMGNGMTFRLELEEPSMDNKAMNAARKAIGETPAVKEAAKKKLAAMLKNDGELNVPWDNDAWLIRFLRLRNYDVPKTYKLIRSYYNFKVKNDFMFKDLMPSKVKQAAEQGVGEVLPNRDPAGSRIVLISAKKWNPKKISLVELIRFAVVLTETGGYEPITQFAGAQIIFDVGGLTWQHIRQFTPNIAKAILQYMTTSAPIKFRGIQIVNQSRTFWTLYNIFKPFMTQEIKSMLHFHGANTKSLHRYIPATSLPDVLGGSFPTPNFSSYEWEVLLGHLDKEYAKLNSYGIKRGN